MHGRLLHLALAALTALTTLLPRDTAGGLAAAPVRARHGMVSSVSRIASQVGVDVMRRGGNAVDAAVATALALAVVWPAAGNLGGGGFMLVRLADGRAVAIDYRETAPAAAHERSYLDEHGEPIRGASLVGPRASGVPGTVAGLAWALERYGTLPWREVVEPARRLAERGFVVSPQLERSLAANATELADDSLARRLFLRDDHPYRRGEKFRQPELAATLVRLERQGPGAFYHGEIADRIVQATGGWITREDLDRYRVVARTPLTGEYRGYTILAMPPPSSGGVLLIEMLHLLEHYDLAAAGFGSLRATHLLAECMRRAFADRARWLGDPDFVQVPVAGLLSRAYADQRAAGLDTAHASPSSTLGAGDPGRFESLETTHFTVVDAAGNVVANTYTLNDSYGSKRVVPGAGFLLNDEMDDFATAPGRPNYYGLVQSEANAVHAGKRPLSSMTPTIVLDHGRPWLALGSPGGPTIISAVLQVLVNVIDHRMDLAHAVVAGRIHHQWLPDSLRVEPGARAPAVLRSLAERGHFVRDYGYMGDVDAIAIDSTGVRWGVGDPRRSDPAVGY